MEYDINFLLYSDSIRAVPKRSTRLAQAESSRNHSSCIVDYAALKVFDPIVKELEMRLAGEGSGSLWDHEIGGGGVHTKAVKFECINYVNNDIQDQLQQFLQCSPNYDGARRRCYRALANHYETSVLNRIVMM